MLSRLRSHFSLSTGRLSDYAAVGGPYRAYEASRAARTRFGTYRPRRGTPLGARSLLVDVGGLTKSTSLGTEWALSAERTR